MNLTKILFSDIGIGSIGAKNGVSVLMVEDLISSAVTIIDITIIVIQMDNDNCYRRHSIYRYIS